MASKGVRKRAEGSNVPERKTARNNHSSVMGKLREALGIKLKPVEMGRLYLSKGEAEKILEKLEDLAYLRQ